MTSSLRWCGVALWCLALGCGSGSSPAADGGTDALAAGVFDAGPSDGGNVIAPVVIELPKYLGRIVITPAALLFTKPGERATLRAEAFDAAGQKIAVPLVWESSRPNDATVINGEVTSVAELGSTQIRVRGGGLVSAPALVIIAEPPAGAVLVSDAQVLQGPTPVDAAGVPTVATKMTITVSGVAELKPGTMLLASEGKAVGGQVISALPGAIAGQQNVVVQSVPLIDLFKRMRVQGVYDINGATLSELLAVPQVPLVSPASGSVSLKPKGQAQLATKPFMLGKFKCELKLVAGAISGDITVNLAPNLSFEHLFNKSDDTGQWTDLMMKLEGTLTVTGTAGLNFAPMLVGTAACELPLYKVPIPIGGPIAAVLSMQVPLGAKGEFALTLSSIPLTAGLELRGESKIQLGFHYTPAGGTKDLSDFTNKLELEPKFTYPVSDLPFVAGSTLSLGGTAGVNIAVALGLGSFSLIEAALMVRADAKLGPLGAQLGDSGFASEYDLKPVLEAGAGEDAKKAMEWFGGAVAVKPMYSVELPTIARSPRGMFNTGTKTVEPGQPVKLEAVLDANSVKFLGLDNVSEVRIYHAGPGMMPELTKTLTASPGQTRFSYTWTPTIGDLGGHLFWAASVSRLAPGIPLRVNKMPPIELQVGKKTRWRGTITCSTTANETKTEGGTTTSHIKAITSTVTAEHETALDALGGLMTIKSFTGSYEIRDTSASSTPRQGTNCGTQVARYESIRKATSSTPAPGSFMQLMIREETGQYTLGGNVLGQSEFETRTITSMTVGSTGAACEKPLNNSEVSMSAYQPLWGCGSMGNYMPGSDQLTGTSTTTSTSKPITTSVATWNFTRF